VAEPVRARRLTEEEGHRLTQIVRRGRGHPIRVRRATIIMASVSGAPVPAIARLVAADEDTVRLERGQNLPRICAATTSGRCGSAVAGTPGRQRRLVWAWMGWPKSVQFAPGSWSSRNLGSLPRHPLHEPDASRDTHAVVTREPDDRTYPAGDRCQMPLPTRARADIDTNAPGCSAAGCGSYQRRQQRYPDTRDRHWSCRGCADGGCDHTQPSWPRRRDVSGARRRPDTSPRGRTRG
jgi:hypothetical protein